MAPSREDMNNLDLTDIKDDLVLVNENSHHDKQEIQNDKNVIIDDDLSQDMNPANHTSCNPNKGLKEKFLIFMCYANYRLKCIYQEMKMKMKRFPFEILKFKYQSTQKPKQVRVPSSSLLVEKTVPEREPTDQQTVPSLEEGAPTSLEKEPTDKQVVPDDKEILSSSLNRRLPSSQNNGLIDKRAILILMVLAVHVPVFSTASAIFISTSVTVGIPGDNIACICIDPSRTALSVQWLVNGTLLENSRLVNAFQEYNNRSKTADLFFNLPLEHNVTTIQCIYNFATENVSSETITLLLQGLLAAVGSPSVNLVDNDISLTWTAPFTLDISKVDPDITYCVDVVNTTFLSIVLSECGITVTGFNFSIPISRVCDNYTFTVTPVNRAGNGTAVTLGYSQDFSPPRASEELLLPLSESTYQITMSTPVCYGELTIINDNTGSETHIQGSDLNITTNNIMFTKENIPKDQLFTVSVNASNINGSAVSYVSLSTHDVMNATFDVISQSITTEYFEYSTAMGALYIFIFINEFRSIDFKKSIYLPLDRSSSHKYTLPDISPGQYQMSVYDIDRDVILHDSVSYPANTNMFSIISDNRQASYSQSRFSELQDCNVTYVDDVISAMCSYSGGSSVTGFQIIVQLNSVTEVHKLNINCTTEYLSPGPVIVQVNESGKYHVAIFPIMGETGIVDSSVEHSQELFVDKVTDVPPTTSSSQRVAVLTMQVTVIGGLLATIWWW